MSLTVLSIVLAVGAGLCYGAFVLYGAWIDGRRQAVREKGFHPVTDDTGTVHGEGRIERIEEEESSNGSKRR